MIRLMAPNEAVAEAAIHENQSHVVPATYNPLKIHRKQDKRRVGSKTWNLKHFNSNYLTIRNTATHPIREVNSAVNRA